MSTTASSSSPIPPEDIRALRRDKYDDDPNADLTADLQRLAAGEPLAYVIGWIPFLGLRIYLDSPLSGGNLVETPILQPVRPLIPRPETEWWTEKLIAHLRERFGDDKVSLLDLCAGSGAIGLAVLEAFRNARVTFAEIIPEHIALIRENLEANGLEISRAHFYEGDLFSALPPDARYNVIATNPPYIPEGRELPASVQDYEPHEALFSGSDGLDEIKRIANEAPEHLHDGGELWLECDTEHAPMVHTLFSETARRSDLLPDLYGRLRLVVSYW